MQRLWRLSFALAAIAAPQARAQDAHEHHKPPASVEPAPVDHAAHDMEAGPSHIMPAMLGPYSMTREASGTSWQPDSSPMRGLMFMVGDWNLMAQASVWGVYSDQGGPRGGDKAFSQSMAMLMASREAGGGRLGLRAMLSLDPLMGKRGYPLLFAVGETADGTTKLVDRQHPHDLFMELAASYSVDFGEDGSAYLYAGLPGEPALGAPTFMHRFSGAPSPEAPISHHWFDSTHITFGVVTAGVSGKAWKLEASAFNGREPDERRWNIDTPRFDSWSVRGFVNPNENLSLQASYGEITEPEELEPGRDESRLILSATYNLPAGDNNWGITAAWSRKDKQPGPVLNAFLIESAYEVGDKHTVFARAERIEQDELFGHDDPLHGQIFDVSKLSLGYIYDMPLAKGVKLGIGALGSAYAYSDRLAPSYGDEGVKSFMLFARLMLGE